MLSDTPEKPYVDQEHASLSQIQPWESERRTQAIEGREVV